MYPVEDETFRQARAIVSALAAELSGSRESRSGHPADLRELVRSAAPTVPAGAEVAFVSALAERLAKTFPVEELFPRKRRAPSA